MCFISYTIFIGIVAVATINFSLAEVWLLIKGGSHLRVCYIFRTYIFTLPSTYLIKNHANAVFCHNFALNKRAFAMALVIMTIPIQLIEIARACSYYSRAATVSFAEFQVPLLFEGGY